MSVPLDLYSLARYVVDAHFAPFDLHNTPRYIINQWYAFALADV